MPGPVVPSAFIAALVGADQKDEVLFTERLLAALGKISPDLLPTTIDHPLADAILEGESAFPRLLELAEADGDDPTRAAALDAIGEIVSRRYATHELVLGLERILSTARSEAVATLAAKALALSGNAGFLEMQRRFLASDEPSQLRISARLLGYGRYTPAVPLLLERLDSGDLAVADVIIWALGEIGDPSALPKLHRLLDLSVQSEPVIEALGKIGDASSAVRLLPVLLEGLGPQRELAAHALAKIARKNDGRLMDEAFDGMLKDALRGVLESDPSRLARFHALVAYSLLGGTLEPARVLTALGGRLEASELDAVSSFYARPKGGGPAKPGRHRGGKPPV